MDTKKLISFKIKYNDINNLFTMLSYGYFIIGVFVYIIRLIRLRTSIKAKLNKSFSRTDDHRVKSMYKLTLKLK